jgi:hypothetical protein
LLQRFIAEKRLSGAKVRKNNIRVASEEIGVPPSDRVLARLSVTEKPRKSKH